MVVGVAILAAAAIASGIMKGRGAKKAAKKEAEAYRRAYELFGQLREEAGVTRKAIDPFSPYREEAGRRLRDITLGDPQAYLAMDPGYQFRLREGTRETERALSARGMNVSGATIAAVQERAQGIASEEYGASVGRLMELGGGYASVGVAGGQAYGQMTQAAIEGQAQALIGKGFSSSRGVGGYYGALSQAAMSAGSAIAGGGGGIGGMLSSITGGGGGSQFMGGGLQGAGGAGFFNRGQSRSPGFMGGGARSMIG